MLKSCAHKGSPGYGGRDESSERLRNLSKATQCVRSRIRLKTLVHQIATPFLSTTHLVRPPAGNGPITPLPWRTASHIIDQSKLGQQVGISHPSLSPRGRMPTAPAPTPLILSLSSLLTPKLTLDPRAASLAFAGNVKFKP